MGQVVADRTMKDMLRDVAKGLQVNMDEYEEKLQRTLTGAETSEQFTTVLVKTALENIDEANPDWTYVASRLYLKKLYIEAANNRHYCASQKYGSLYELIVLLTEKGIYHPHLIEKYSRNEIEKFEQAIDPACDELFHYLSIYTLATRYLATDHEKNVYELPQ